MNSTRSLLSFALCALLFACSSPTGTSSADPAQVAKLSLVASALTSAGAAVVLQQDPSSRPVLLSIAEVIEQAAALPEAPPPHNLANLVSAAAMKFGGPYGALAGIGLQAGLQIYSQLYASNTSSALDKQPAFRAVLLSMAGSLRASANAPAGVDLTPHAAAVPTLSAEDFVLQPAR